MKIKVNFEIFNGFSKIIEEINKTKLIPHKEYILVLSKDMMSCGIYLINKSYSLYKQKLDSNGQGYVYLGKADERGKLRIQNP